MAEPSTKIGEDPSDRLVPLIGNQECRSGNRYIADNLMFGFFVPGPGNIVCRGLTDCSDEHKNAQEKQFD